MKIAKRSAVAAMMLGMGALVAGVRADAPVVAWASYPVGAGDHVILHGGSWGNHVRVVTEGEKTSPATVLSDTGMAFKYMPIAISTSPSKTTLP